MDLGHGGAAIGLALPVEPLLMGAEIGDPRLDLGLEVVPRSGRAIGAGFGGSATAPLTASTASMSGIGVGAFAVLEVSTGSRVTDVATVFSASGFLPVTDCTNAIVCAIRRSRSFIHFMKHLGPRHSIKRLLWNQAGVEVTGDNAGAFAREVTKLRQFVLLACIWRPRWPAPQAVSQEAAMLAFARIGVGQERRADHADRRLIADVDDLLVG